MVRKAPNPPASPSMPDRPSAAAGGRIASSPATGPAAQLPWWPGERGRPAPEHEPLSREQIVRAAIAIIDGEGVDALSMRRLGRELGAGATSLYWHVKDKDELLDLILDEVLGEVDLSVADPAQPWRERAFRSAHELRRVLASHRGVSQIFGSRVTVGPKLLDGYERFIAIFRDAGFRGRGLALATQTVLNYATGFAVFESRGVTGPMTEGRTAEEVQALVGQMLGSLPAERFPTLVSVAADMTSVTDDESFEYGLGRILDGLELDLARSNELP